jgi:hypothetical protein
MIVGKKIIKERIQITQKLEIIKNIQFLSK